MNTHSHLLTLRRLIALVGGRLLVPAYQRRYVWGQPRPGGAVHSARFMAECINEMLCGGEPLFLSGITLTCSERGYEIVDGQQRLTFLCLLLIRLGRSHPNAPALAIGYECRPDAQAWMDAARDGEKPLLSELPAPIMCEASPTGQDAALFEMTLSTINQMWPDIDSWPRQKVDMVLDRISVLCIEITDRKHAVPAFRMMNGTKLPMQPADVIKADMMRRAAEEEADAQDFSPMRWRYALEWQEWVVWWNRADVQEYYKHCLADGEPPISLLLKLCLRSSDHSELSPLSYEEFRRAIADDPAGKQHAAKAFYDLLRHTQKRIEDAYEDACRYCRLKAIMLLQEPAEVVRFLRRLFVDCSVSADDLERYYKLSFLSMSIADIESGVPVAPKLDELIATLSMADIYHTENKREAFNLLLRLNIDEDIKLGRKFDFSIWNNRSLEHIFSKSKVWHIDSEGHVVDGNDTPLHMSPERARKDSRMLCRDSIVSADGMQLSEHCIGNLVLLYGQNNAAFGNSGFESKKMMFLAPGDIGAFRSRNLLHSVCVFASNNWDARRIVDNYALTLKNLKLYYGDIDALQGSDTPTTPNLQPPQPLSPNFTPTPKRPAPSGLPAEVRPMTVENLLGGEHSLVIPDMQRDFTWGAHQAKALVSGLAFVFHNVRAAASTFADNPVGLIYGYTSPSGHIHIIDGQQRLTTLFLLIGMLYRRTSLPSLRPLLISEEELGGGGRLPRIVYQAKRQALYFLSDLVTHFFLNRDGRLSQITKASWYFTDYASDQSVQSFIGALQSIDQVLEQCAEQPDFSFEGFARFVARCVSFRYGRLPGRTNAEGLFVTINTTGEPLSAAQSLRALHVAMDSGSDVSAASRWNTMEQYFWQRRTAPSLTSDSALDSFLSLTAPLMPEHLPAPTLADVYSCFEAYRRLEEALEGKLPTGQTDAALQGAIAFARKFCDADALSLQRFTHLLCNVSLYQKIDTATALALVEALPQPDVLCLLHMRHAPERIANAEEKAKLSALAAANSPQQRLQMEALFARAEAHPLMRGRIAPLLKWCGQAGTESFISAFEHYTEEIYRIWGTDIERSDRLDTLRRVMLCLRHPAYPIVRKGDTVLSLCWHDYDWQRLMQTSPGIVRLLIDRLQNLSMQEIINRFADRNYAYYHFIKDKSLTATMRKKQLLRPCEAFIGYYHLADAATHWLVDRQRLKLPAEQWGPLRLVGFRSLVSAHRQLPLALSLTYTPADRRPYRLELFSTAEGKDRLRPSLAELAPRDFSYHKPSGRYRAYFADSAEALAVMRRVAANI